MVCGAKNQLTGELYHWYSVPMDGEEFKRKRHQLGLTQAQLANKLGVTATAVARWERGERSVSEPVARFLTLLCQLAKGKRRAP
jgi:transcriptional regulator with XRE-family HTH domain